MEGCSCGLLKASVATVQLQDEYLPYTRRDVLFVQEFKSGRAELKLVYKRNGRIQAKIRSGLYSFLTKPHTRIQSACYVCECIRCGDFSLVPCMVGALTRTYAVALHFE